MSTEQECTTRTIHGDNEKRNVQETRLSGSWCSSYEYRKYKLSVKPFRSPYYGRFSGAGSILGTSPSSVARFSRAEIAA